VTTYFLHLLTICSALGDEPRACITYAVENRALCEAGMRIAYADLFPEDRDIYIGCEQTNILTSTIKPRSRP
jgi:hypothetical protein